ncbi:hypothetical protein ACLOAV_008709 [Pseudogymnoascus australis]
MADPGSEPKRKINRNTADAYNELDVFDPEPFCERTPGRDLSKLRVSNFVATMTILDYYDNPDNKAKKFGSLAPNFFVVNTETIHDEKLDDEKLDDEKLDDEKLDDEISTLVESVIFDKSHVESVLQSRDIAGQFIDSRIVLIWNLGDGGDLSRVLNDHGDGGDSAKGRQLSRNMLFIGRAGDE